MYLFRDHRLLSPLLEVRLWHCLQRRYFSHWSSRKSLSEALQRRRKSGRQPAPRESLLRASPGSWTQDCVQDQRRVPALQELPVHPWSPALPPAGHPRKGISPVSFRVSNRL